MSHRISKRLRRVLIAAVATGAVAALASGCMQELDSGAASGGAATSNAGADAGGGGSTKTGSPASAAPPEDAGVSAQPPDEDANGLSTWQLCQSPSCDLVSGEVPFLDQTPPIYLPDASTTPDPCVEVEQASMAVRTTYCAACHQAPADQAGINFILDDTQLASALSQSATNEAGAPEKLIVPGDPTHSWFYVRIAAGIGGGAAGMPPATMPGYPTIPRPTSADLSVLYGWITACAPGADGGGYDLGGGGYAPVVVSDAGVDASNGNGGGGTDAGRD